MDDLENWPSNINVVLPSTDDAKTQKLIELQLILMIHMQKCIVREMKDTNDTWICNRPHCESAKKLWKHMLFCRDRVSCAVPYCVFSKQILRHWKYCEKDNCPVRLSTEQNINTGDAMIEKLREVVTPTMLRVQCDSDIAQFAGTPIIGNIKERYLLITSDIREQYVQELIKEIFSTKYFRTLADERVCDLVDFAKKAEIKMFEKAKSRDEYYQLTTEMKHRIPKEIEKRLEQQMTQQQAAQQRSSEVTIESQTASTTDSPSAEAATAANIESPIDVKQLFVLIDSGGSGDSQPPEGHQSSQIAMQSLPEIKDWHRSITPDLRAHIIQKLAKSIYPKPIERGIALDPRLKNLVPWATKLEGHYFQMANSINEYYHMIASKIYTVEHCREEIRAKKSAQTPQQQSAEQQVSEPQQSTIVHPADTNPSNTGGAPVAAVIQSADEVGEGVGMSVSDT